MELSCRQRKEISTLGVPTFVKIAGKFLLVNDAIFPLSPMSQNGDGF